VNKLKEKLEISENARIKATSGYTGLEVEVQKLKQQLENQANSHQTEDESNQRRVEKYKEQMNQQLVRLIPFTICLELNRRSGGIQRKMS